MKTFFTASLLGVMVWCFAAPAHSQSPPDRINAICASLVGDHAALYVAQDMGLFRKYSCAEKR